MFAGNRDQRRLEAREQLFGVVELRGFGEVRDVARVHDECRLIRQTVDRIDRGVERSGDVAVGRFVEADVVSLIWANQRLPSVDGGPSARAFAVNDPTLLNVKAMPAPVQPT